MEIKGTQRLWKEDIALIQDMRKSCKKREHSIKHWRKLKDYDHLEPVLQSSTEQWGLHFALKRAAVRWCWVTAHLYEGQISIGVFAVKHCLL